MMGGCGKCQRSNCLIDVPFVLLSLSVPLAQRCGWITGFAPTITSMQRDVRSASMSIPDIAVRYSMSHYVLVRALIRCPAWLPRSGGLGPRASLTQAAGAVIDRDVMPEIGAGRHGVPQGRHTHILHQRGRQVLDERFLGSRPRSCMPGPSSETPWAASAVCCPGTGCGRPTSGFPPCSPAGRCWRVRSAPGYGRCPASPSRRAPTSPV